jgi:hypothetical protein
MGDDGIDGGWGAAHDEDFERRERVERDAGAVRRAPSAPDGKGELAPHRAGVVIGLGATSFALALATCAHYGLCLPVAIPLGIIAWVMGVRDMRRMRTGEIDPAGRSSTQLGLVFGIIGTSLGALFVLLVGAIGLLVPLYEEHVEPSESSGWEEPIPGPMLSLSVLIEGVSPDAPIARIAYREVGGALELVGVPDHDTVPELDEWGGWKLSRLRSDVGGVRRAVVHVEGRVWEDPAGSAELLWWFEGERPDGEQLRISLVGTACEVVTIGDAEQGELRER